MILYFDFKNWFFNRKFIQILLLLLNAPKMYKTLIAISNLLGPIASKSEYKSIMLEVTNRIYETTSYKNKFYISYYENIRKKL